MTTRTPKREQFLADVLTTAVEGGINYWATVRRYKWEGRAPADYFAEVYDTEDAETEAVPVHRIDIAVVARGIGVLLETFKDRGPETYWHQFRLANRTNSDEGDYDAAIADMIVQAGLFGEVVYG